jgi:hypothetical protein
VAFDVSGAFEPHNNDDVVLPSVLLVGTSSTNDDNFLVKWGLNETEGPMNFLKRSFALVSVVIGMLGLSCGANAADKNPIKAKPIIDVPFFF